MNEIVNGILNFNDNENIISKQKIKRIEILWLFVQSEIIRTVNEFSEEEEEIEYLNKNIKSLLKDCIDIGRSITFKIQSK
jgi:hypothetical protein